MLKSRVILSAGAIAGVSAALALQGGVSSKIQVPLTPQTPKYFALDLQGSYAGVFASYQGGPNGNPLGKGMSLTPSPISAQVGLSMGKPVYDWINTSWKQSNARKNGAIIAADFNYKEMGRLEFINALIEEVSFPMLDTSYPATGYFGIKFRPERTFPRAANPRSGPIKDNPQKPFTTSNFRVSIGDLPCARISKVEAFTIKQNSPMGLNFYFSTADAAAWQAKVNAPGVGIPGRIEFLAQDKSTVMAAFSFKLQRVRMVQAAPQPGPDGPRSMAYTAISDPQLIVP